MFQFIRDLIYFTLPELVMPTFGLNSVLDILVISYIIYHILLWIKQSRAWTLFKGIAFLLLVSAISYLLDMKTVMWIISNTFSAGLLAVIIIFQPEIRKALENLGKGKLISFFSPADGSGDGVSSHIINEIITAATKMSKVRTGALIVLEQQVPLGDLESTGIPIDAVVSSQLIINIFENKTPLHDGAVLIRNGRVSAATCILPLSQDQLSSDLGTRHRAAIGASQVSDAFIIVVSEETGNISIAKEGKLRRNVSKEEMYEMLSQPETEPKRKSLLRKGRAKE